MSKQQLLDNLRKQALEDNSLPLKETANSLVFGEGSINPKIYFLGEAPGRNEDLQGRPFIGQAGKLLDKLFKSIGLSRWEVFITSVLWFRPPNNRDPLPEEIEAFKKYLDEQIKIINPQIIVTLGRFSLNKFLPDVKISKVHGKPQEINLNNQRVNVVPMYHPAAGLRNGKLLETLKKDFLILKEFI